ncbi:MAG: hypothetical protein M3T96_07330 [Acidobacteriota bacterium]|nr:hypothetical protein [Acidobacteriota bacterium]
MNRFYYRIIYLSVVFFLGLAVGSASAQKVIASRVKLSANVGANEVEGTLPKGDLTRVYVLRAAKNQRLKVSVSFTGHHGEADFSLKRPDGADVDEANIINDQWEGILPQTGDYKINVFNPAKIRGTVKYTLKISLQ